MGSLITVRRTIKDYVRHMGATWHYNDEGVPVNSDSCEGCTHGVVTLGRFTIPALLPVEVILPAQDRAPGTNQYATDHDRLTVHPLTSECYLWLNGNGRDVALVPLPRPGQFITRPERVEETV